MEKELGSTVQSHQTEFSSMTQSQLLEDKEATFTFWKAYKEDFRIFKLFNTKRKDKTIENFRKMNPK